MPYLDFNSISLLGLIDCYKTDVNKNSWCWRQFIFYSKYFLLNDINDNMLNARIAKQKNNEYFNLTNRIITTERDNKTSPQAIVNFFYNLYKEIGFEGCSSHSGRRTFITTAAKNISLAGGTLNDIRMLAGHSTLATTQRYIEYNTDEQKKIVEMV